MAGTCASTPIEFRKARLGELLCDVRNALPLTGISLATARASSATELYGSIPLSRYDTNKTGRALLVGRATKIQPMERKARHTIKLVRCIIWTPSRF